MRDDDALGRSRQPERVGDNGIVVAADVTDIGLVVVLVDFFKGSDIAAGSLIGYDMTIERYLLDTLELDPVGDDAADIAVVDDVLDLLRL